MSNPQNEAQIYTGGHAIGMYRLTALRHMCEMEVKGMKMSRGQNACASARKEFQIPGRSRQEVVDFLKEHIHNINTTGVEVDCYGHIKTDEPEQESPEA